MRNVKVSGRNLAEMKIPTAARFGLLEAGSRCESKAYLTTSQSKSLVATELYAAANLEPEDFSNPKARPVRRYDLS